MLRTVFMIGLFALAGLFLLKMLGVLFFAGFGLLGWLFSFAIKALIIGGLVYLVIRIFSPETARKLREKFSGDSY